MKNLYLNFAVKSLFNRIRQYRSLFAVSAVGVCIMLSVLMITDGMLDSMTEKMRQFYGGDFMIVGGKEDNDNFLSDSQKMVDCLKTIVPKGAEVSYRYSKNASDKSFYFEGVGVKQRTIQGVDFAAEKKLFEKFTFVEGNAEPRPSHDGVVISLPVANKLGVHIGDEITLFYDDFALKNTIMLVVTGVFQDSSVFGMYTSYIDYNAMMQLLTFQEPVIDKICVYYSNGIPAEKEIRRVQSELENQFKMFPLSGNKEDWQNLDTSNIDEIYALIPLSANVSDLKKLSMALNTIVALIVIMLVVIISVGISSTFRVIVMKRSVESGTFRALGMKPSGLMLLYFTEVLVLLVSGCFIGFVFAFIVSRFSSTFNLSFISGFDLFLTGGHLDPSFYVKKVAGLVAVIFVTTLGAVLFTLRKLIHISPVGALSTIT